MHPTSLLQQLATGARKNNTSTVRDTLSEKISVMAALGMYRRARLLDADRYSESKNFFVQCASSLTDYTRLGRCIQSLSHCVRLSLDIFVAMYGKGRLHGGIPP